MSEKRSQSIPVAIVGGGPVGLVLALFLDMYGVDSIVFNATETTRWHPKGSTHNSRTMEHYRRLGLSERIRMMGLPGGHPTDVAYFTRYNAYELARCVMPSTLEKLDEVSRSPSIDQVPEPIHRGNQMYVERFLLEEAASRKHIRIKFGSTVFAVSDRGSHVSLNSKDTGGSIETFDAQYVVGCDGGRSFIRKALGIRYSGFDSLEQAFMGGAMLSSYLRAPALYPKYLGARKAWHYWALNNDVRSVLTTINGADEFLLMTKIEADRQPCGPEDTIARVRAAAGDPELEVEVISQEPWTAGAALVAESFGRGRIFLAGDAVHLFTPTGGFGMNTGIDDAANLSWKLAGVMAGWGGAELMDSYEIERRPIALRNTDAAREYAKSVGSIDLPNSLEENSPRGEQARRQVEKIIDEFGEEYASLGVQLGARYDNSPIILRDAEPPPNNLVKYEPSSVPGGRAPHFWFGESRERGASIFDHLGNGFTLLSFVEDERLIDEFTKAARERGVPFQALRVDHPEARAMYNVYLVLIRPDQHIAWRGNETPNNPAYILDKVCGRQRG
jgi:2-polyprenyl-6-methoxyphenol hydroxylase-like FAD-dependent oxidoreductase